MCNARDYDADRYAQFLCVPCGIPLAFVPHDFDVSPQLYIYQLDSTFRVFSFSLNYLFVGAWC